MIKLSEPSNHSLLAPDIAAKPLLQFISFVEVFASMVQIYTILLKSIQILLSKSKDVRELSKCNTFTLLQLENICTIYSFLYFILSRHDLFIACVRLLIFSLFSLYRHFSWSHTSNVALSVSQFAFFSNSYIFHQQWTIMGGHKIAIQF